MPGNDGKYMKIRYKSSLADLFRESMCTGLSIYSSSMSVRLYQGTHFNNNRTIFFVRSLNSDGMKYVPATRLEISPMVG